MNKPKAIKYYKFKDDLTSFCWKCQSLTNKILEFSDGSDIPCCDNCSKNVFKYKYKKNLNRVGKSLDKQQSLILGQNPYSINQEKPNNNEQETF